MGDGRSRWCRSCWNQSPSIRYVCRSPASCTVLSTRVQARTRLSDTKHAPALSITWVVLALPATFAEVIGVAVRKPGAGGYLDVQLFAGFMYIGGAISGMSPAMTGLNLIILKADWQIVWLLRAWKVCELERKRDEAAQGAEGSLEMRVPSRESKSESWSRFARGLWVITKA